MNIFNQALKPLSRVAMIVIMVATFAYVGYGAVLSINDVKTASDARYAAIEQMMGK